MSLAVQDIRDYARSFIDVDSTDIPDLLCDMWMRDGFARMVRSSVTWPFYAVGGIGNPYTVTTVNGQQNYSLPTVAIQGTAATVPARNLVAVQGPHWELQAAAPTALETAFPPAFIVSQEPERYSTWGTYGVTLWPIPNGVYTLNVRAYRDPIDWVGLGAGGIVDAPDDWHTVLTSYVLSMGWAQQTDLEQSSYWLQQFEKGASELKTNYLRAPLQENLQLNAGGVQRGLPPRLRFPFDGINYTW